MPRHESKPRPSLEITFEQVPRVTVSSFAQSVDIRSWPSGNSNLPANYFPRKKSEWLPQGRFTVYWSDFEH
jgi:hypothetical protein